ncbi:MAG TPA: HAMP domain-containing sensor histidine kinase [Spirochaetota bacterium]|nr:HAMP domain-containing sensor histidine kinase [Spirochaetota bacterium]HOM38392.1 HAMP domain-containing sensor histidine kinase [Spirochaetota bacterium]HPQ48390.1 HAMP domain-containing sensor histidine kinase [Spirochaetota bacterium]
MGKNVNFKNFFTHPEEYEKQRKNVLIELFTYSFTFYLIIYSIIDLFVKYSPIAFLLLFCLISGQINFILFKKNKIKINTASLIILTCSIIIFSSLFYFGGISNSGIFWVILFPVMSFSLSGTKKGLILSLGMFLILVFIYFIIKPIPSYPLNYTIILFSVYILISLFSFFYQYSIEQYTNIITITTRNLSESKEKLEDYNKQLEHINSINSKIVALISHDIKANIGSIKSILEKADPDYINETVKTAIMALEATNETLEKLVNWYKIQVNKHQYTPINIPINELINKVLLSLEPFIKSKSIEIIKDFRAESLVIGDINMLESVLRNIILNSIKFTKCGKEIKICTETNGIYVKVGIEDKGSGIPEQVIKQLESNQSIDSTPGSIGEKGSGLGLIITKEYLAKHNSRLEIKNTGNGAIVSFNLLKS